MGLDIFEKAENPEEEKTLEVFVSEEAIIDTWIVCVAEAPFNRDWEETFLAYKKALQRYKGINSSIVKKVNEKLPKEGVVTVYGGAKGLFLSALVQTSYDQGFNDFEFGEIDSDLFGYCLKGKENNIIRIKAEEISGNHLLRGASYCLLKAGTINNMGFEFISAENCVIEIANCQFEKFEYFGVGMKNCKIYSPNEKIFKELQTQMGKGREGNEFVFGNIPRGFGK